MRTGYLTFEPTRIDTRTLHELYLWIGHVSTDVIYDVTLSSTCQSLTMKGGSPPKSLSDVNAMTGEFCSLNVISVSKMLKTFGGPSRSSIPTYKSLAELIFRSFLQHNRRQLSSSLLFKTFMQHRQTNVINIIFINVKAFSAVFFAHRIAV